MNSLIVLVLLICTFATGHAITCTKCTEGTSDDPNLQPPADPSEPVCSSNPGEMECPSGISSCSTTTTLFHFTRDAGPLTMSQEKRDCGPPADTGLPTGDTCVAEHPFIDAIKAILSDPSATISFPPELGLTYQGFNISVCLCDSADKCTPPSPAAEAAPETEPAAGDGDGVDSTMKPAAVGIGDGVDSTMKPTTPSGAAGLVSCMALVLGSLLNVFLCRVV